MFLKRTTLLCQSPHQKKRTLQQATINHSSILLVNTKNRRSCSFATGMQCIK